MGEWVKKILRNIAPYGLIERRHRKQREKEKEERMRQEERKKEEEKKKKEEEKRRKEEEKRKKEEEKKKKEEEKRRKFLQERTSRKWGTFYAGYHEKEELEERWILYEASEGVGMVSGPYALFEAFRKRLEFEDYIHIWVVQEEGDRMLLEQKYQQYENVVFIYYCSKAYAYFLSKSKYLINNDSFPFMFSKKEGQIFLNTWHGTMDETPEYGSADGRKQNKNTVRNLLMSDYIISPNDAMTEIFEKSYRLTDLFSGYYIQEGDRSQENLEKVIDTVFYDECHSQLIKSRRTEKKRILMFAGGFYMDGVTSAALALLQAIDYQKYDVSLFITALKSEMQEYNFDKIPDKVRVLLRCNTLSMTEEQKYVYDMIMREGFEIDQKYQPMQEYLAKKEYSRCFGESQFDYLIDFSGYGLYFSWLTLKQCPSAKKFIWQHNDMLQDLTNEKKRSLKNTVTTIDGLLSMYSHYDKIVSASKAVYEVNKKNLETDATKGKFTYCGNLLDGERIERQISVDGNCSINGKRYLRVVNSVRENGVEEATLIPFEGGKEEYIRFVTMGRCMPEKNHYNLILALKRLTEEGIPCKLYIIGDGQGREELEMLAEESGLQDRVIITGFVTNPFVIMKECDCFVFPSIYEAQGLAVLEARMVGLPIIVSNYPAVESVFLGEQQYLINGTEVDDIYEGLQAYKDGRVPKEYQFSVEEYNQKIYEEFVSLMND